MLLSLFSLRKDLGCLRVCLLMYGKEEFSSWGGLRVFFCVALCVRLSLTETSQSQLPRVHERYSRNECKRGGTC